MTYNYKSENFSGPLDLLWEMLRKEEFEISQISLAHLTDQYLDYVNKNEEKLSSDELSEFLKIATLLLKMKLKYISKLWKHWEEEDNEDEESLLWQLKIYDKYHKALLSLLKKNDLSKIKYISRNKIQNPLNKVENNEAEISNLNLYLIQDIALSLKTLWQRRFKKWQINKFKILDVKEKINDLNDKLNNFKQLNFSNLRNNLEKSEIIANFLALLELVKQNTIKLEQKNNFEEIIIEKI